MKFYAFLYKDGSSKIEDTWNQSNIKGYSGVLHKSFSTRKDAENFILESKSEKVNSSQSEYSEVVYCDGGCINNGSLDAFAGVGVWFGDNDPRNVSMALDFPPHSNQRAELRALWLAIEILKREKHEKPTLIVTDSLYSINCVKEWCKKWIKEDWWPKSLEESKNPNLKIKNIDLIYPIVKLLEGENIELKHVYGHKGNHGNEMADSLATNGILKNKKE